MPFEWGEKLLETVLGGLPGAAKLLPPHWRQQLGARLQDYNPFAQIAANDDLLRALRLAWIEAALEIDQAVVRQAKLTEWQAQAADVARFSALFTLQMRRLRHEACNRLVHPGQSPIDRHLSILLMEVPSSVRAAAGPPVGQLLTDSFVATAALVAGWPAEEVPLLYGQLAAAGLPLAGAAQGRPFGELAFAAFAELIKDPSKHPEASQAFAMAMDDMARELALATLDLIRGMDARTTQVLDELKASQHQGGWVDFLQNLDRAWMDRWQALAAQIDAVHDTVKRGHAQLQEGLSELRSRAADAVPPRTPWQLPPRAIDCSFSGRTDALTRLIARLQRSEPTTCVVGPAGFGKTALAAEALHQVVGAGGRVPGHPYPDGVVFLDLYRLKAVADAVWTALADALIGGGDEQSAAESRARRACVGRHVLVIVEGAELADGLQVASRLPELLRVLSPENCVLVLTRDSSQGLPVQTISVDQPLDEADAKRVFDRLAQPAPSETVRQHVLALLHGHPLALTWAASLLADPAEDAGAVLEEWRRAQLPNLNDPLCAEHTLGWLFNRSVRGLDAEAQVLMQALALLAHAPVQVTAAAAALAAATGVADGPQDGGSARARQVLRRLVHRSILRRLVHTDGQAAWQFSHVLAYRFARQAWPDRRLDGVGLALLDWCRDDMLAGPSARDPGQAQVLMPTALLHAGSLLLSTPAGHPKHWHLYVALQYHVVVRHLHWGQLGLVARALEAAAAWFEAERTAGAKTTSRYHRERGVHLSRRGDLHRVQGQLLEAQKAYEEYLALTRRLAQNDPSNAQLQRDLGISLKKIGGIWQAQGRLDDALKACEESLALARCIAQSDPRNTEWQRDVGIPLEMIGGIRQARGRLDEATKAYEEYLALARRLAQSDPNNAVWQRDLCISLEKVGGIRQAQGRLEEALKAYEESLALTRRLAQSDPSNTQWQYDLGVSLVEVGGIWQAQGRLDEALEAYEESLTLMRSLTQSDPRNAQWRRDLGTSLSKVGDIRQAQGRLDEALKAFEQHLALTRQLAQSDPSNTMWQCDLCVSLERVGGIWQEQGGLEEALKAYNETLALRRRLAQSDPSNTQWQRDLGASLVAVGGIWTAQGRLDEALEAYEESLNLMRSLAQSDPSNAEWQCDLGTLISNVGDIRQTQGRLDEALKAFEEHLALMRQLARSDPRNTRWQRDQSYSLKLLAELLASMGHLDRACEYAQESLQIDRRLSAIAPDHATWQHDLRVSLALVDRLCNAA